MFIELCTEGRTQWSALETDSGRRLIEPDPAVFFGPRHGPWSDFAEAVARTGGDVRPLPLAEARSRLGWLRLHDGDAVLMDHSAGVIHASATLEALLEQAVNNGVVTHPSHPVLALEARSGGGWILSGPRSELEADIVVVCAGPWTTRLVPALSQHLRVVPQTAVLLPEVPRLPVWAWLGRGDEPEVAGSFYYGLENGPHREHKCARHDLEGAALDPEEPRPELDPSEVLDFWSWRIRPPAGQVRTEPCRYTLSPTEDFVLDAVPEAPGLFVGTGLSGHGFKFGPVLGRVLAERVLGLEGSVAAVAASPARFAFPTS